MWESTAEELAKINVTRRLKIGTELESKQRSGNLDWSPVNGMLHVLQNGVF